MKIIKWFIGIIVLLVILIIIALVCLGIFVNPNDYKPQIEKAFHQKTGMVLKIPGKLGWRLFPTVGIKTSELDIAKTSASKPFVTMSQVDISVMPWSLIMGEISSVDATAKSFTYDKMSFKGLTARASNISSRNSFPFELLTTANLGLPHPLHIDLKTNVKFDSTAGSSLYLNHILAKLNNSDLSGSMSVEDFNRPHILVNLSSNTFYVADYVDLKGARLPLRDVKVTANLNAAGTDDKNFPSTLNGTIDTAVGSSQLRGVDVGATLAKIRNAIKGAGKSGGGFNLSSITQIQSLLQPQKHSSSKINPNNGKVTNIGSFTMNGVVTKGVLENHKILITGKHYNMAGAGYVDLNKKTLSYNFNIYGKHNEVVNGKTVRVPDDYVVPFFAKGPWTNIQKGINYPELSKQIQKLLTKKLKKSTIQKLTDKLGDKVPANLKAKIGGLLNNFLGK